MPDLVVLLPVKDGAATIRRAVTSTLRAMPRDAQLLVVDDGSSDGTGAELARIADRRLRVLRHERSLGVAASLNAGLDATDSRVVARMDADDLSLPWRFAVQSKALAGADLVFGSLLLIDGRGRPIGAGSPAAVSPAQAALHLLIENPFAHPTLVARREAIARLGGYRGTPVEDYDLWLRAATAGRRLRKLRTPVLAYRRHAGQLTQSWTRDAPDELLDDSYGALLPAGLRGRTGALRRAAVFREHGPADAEHLAALREHLLQASSALDAGSRRRLRRRLGRPTGQDR